MSDQSQNPQPETKSLGTQAARGVFWLGGPAMISRVISFGCDIVLAWFLARSQLGEVGIAVGVAAIFATIHQAGLRDILTQRQARFDLWVTPVFWLSLTLAVGCMLGMIASAGVFQRFFAEPHLRELIMLMSVRCLFDGLCIAPQALLTKQMRFRAIGGVQAVAVLTQAVVSVVLASPLFSLGAFSIVWGLLASSGIQMVLFWACVRPHIGVNPRFRRWRWVFRDSGFAVAIGLVGIVVGYGDSSVLGFFHDADVVGVYYLAYRLAVQAGQLIGLNLVHVMFAALTQITDRQRQFNAVMSASRMLGVLVVPLQFLQAAVADPLFRFLYPERWHGAILPFQLLSIGMAVTLLGSPGGSLIKAQRRFGLLFAWTAITSAAYFGMICLGASVGAAIGVAIAVAAFYAITGPLWLVMALGMQKGIIRELLPVFLWPLLVSGAACVVGWLASHFVPIPAGYTGKISYALQMAVIVLVSLGVYLVLLKTLLPQHWREAAERLQQFRGRRGG